jgi:excisionase family DNA binding protein
MTAPAATRPVRGDRGFDLPPLPLLYRPKQVAALVGISRPAVSAAIARGELAAFRLNGCVLVRREAIEEWINEFARPWRAKK